MCNSTDDALSVGLERRKTYCRSPSSAPTSDEMELHFDDFERSRLTVSDAELQSTHDMCKLFHNRTISRGKAHSNPSCQR